MYYRSHQQTNPPLYKAYTDMYRVTDSAERYLPLQSFTGLFNLAVSLHKTGHHYQYVLSNTIQTLLLSILM